MNDQLRRTEPKDPRVEAALQEYLERFDRGEVPDRDKFISQHAEIADELRSFIAAEEQLRKLAGAKTAGEPADNPTQSFALHGQETIAPLAAAKRSAESGLKQEFGRYRIFKTLGKGAMGTVYLAEDTQLQRHVAIKTPHFEQEPTPELLERFYREARAAATLRHPNICPVYDVGQIEGAHYISMAFIEGHSLSAFIQPAKPQPERQVLIVVRKLAQALQDAHDHGIVHRDLKPANIMVDTRNEPIIMDFGLARQLHRDTNIRITQSGMLIGTPAYMSPEQIEGELDKIGPPTDQYSLGVILYELLTGQLPFRGSIAAVMGQIVTKEPTPPSHLRLGLDPRIEAVSLKMISKNPSDRFPCMSAVAEQLATILKSPGAKATSKEEAPSSPVPSPSVDRMGADIGASQVLKSLKQKMVTESDLASLEELARKCWARRDYEQVIQIIERISEERRNVPLQTLLQKARDKTDAIAYLICEIDEAVRLDDAPTALKKAEELLKIKPGHHRARQIQEKYAGFDQGGAARIGPLRQFTRPWNEGGWIPWSALAFGLAVFGMMSYSVTVYLRTGKAVSKVEINEPNDEATKAREVADLHGKRADEQRTIAEARELTARRYLYASQMNLAQQTWEAGGVKRVMELLDGQRPQSGQRDLRRFDWYYRWRLCHSDLLTLPRREREINSVAISPDGKSLATSTNVIELWDLPNAKLRATLNGHGSDVNMVVFSPDGNKLASVSDDALVTIWDGRSGKPLASLKGHTDKVTGVAFSPDGRRLASCSIDGTVKLWRLPPRVAQPSSDDSTGQLLRTGDAGTPGQPIMTLTHGSHVYGVAFSPDGRLLASAARDKAVRLWDAVSGELRATLEGHKDPVTPVAFSPNGKLLASGSDDTTIKLWDPANGHERATLTGHKDWVEALAFSSDGRFLASGSRDSTLKLWEVADVGAAVALGGDSPSPPARTIGEWTTFKGHTNQVNSLAFTPDGKTLASASSDRTAKLWNVVRGQEQVTLREHTGRLYSVVVSPDGKLLASGGDDGTARIWDLATRQHRQTLAAQTGRVKTVAFSPNNKVLAVGGGNTTVKLFDVATGRERVGVSGVQHPGGTIECARFSPDGTLLASSGPDHTVRLWDLATGHERATLTGHKTWVASLAFSPDGKLLASGTPGNSTVKLWDVVSGSEKFSLDVTQTPNRSDTGSLAFSPDGRTLASGSSDNTVNIWDLPSGRHRPALLGHAAAVNAVAFSPDGKLLASASDDATIKLWDVATGQDLVTLKGHTTVVRSVSFSPDGKTLASASFDQTVKLWNVEPATEAEVLAYDGQNQMARIAVSDARNALPYDSEARVSAPNPDTRPESGSIRTATVRTQPSRNMKSVPQNPSGTAK